MRGDRWIAVVRIGSVLMLGLMMAACTKGGQFDPTEVFASDMFDTKKRLKGERKEVFPEGVPGASTGVPPELIKGYQPPPEPQAAEADATGATATAAAAPAPEAEKPKPKPKKKKVARTPPAGASDPIWDQKPPTQVDVRRSAAPAPAAAAQPAAPPTAAQPSIWPAPPAPQRQQSQTVWPDPPSTFSR